MTIMEKKQRLSNLKDRYKAKKFAKVVLKQIRCLEDLPEWSDTAMYPETVQEIQR